jgi:DNA-binding protein H-NS
MAKVNGLEKMSYAELSEMEREIARLKVGKHSAERDALREQLSSMAKEHGFDIRDLFGKGRGGKVAAKYRDPKNPENTWTGRGGKIRLGFRGIASNNEDEREQDGSR